MKYFPLITLMIISIFSGCSQKMYLEDWGYVTDKRSKVELRTYEIKFEGDEIVNGKLTNKFTNFYNQEGMLTEIWESLNSETEAKIKNKFIYDKKKRTITFISYRKDTIQIYKLVHTFDKKYRQILKEYFDHNNIKSSITQHFFEPNGFDFFSYQYTAEGQLESKSFTQKNKKGQILKSITYNEDGSVKNFCTFTYNIKGLETEAICFHPDGREEFGTRNKKYDRKDYLLYSESNGFQGKKTINTYEISYSGNKARIIGYTNGKPSSIEEVTVFYDAF